ncbi:glycosyltransferase family 4 protein [Roseinatronobacter sp. S2]|uniref:glycosyltransferase family 4 protein n=1 Tax=Roseinatronobacter sp. S2 TaxID=3035471 RepID=UPI00240F8EC2|nr:glycosyltransferase family 4 protein [Roseinatronobacter sp. S2]WFE75343.1 glycosyltransferase family 4 protein [Roseinatronobacter sp. S2]
MTRKVVLSVIHGPRWGGIHGIAELIAAPLQLAGVHMVIAVPDEFPDVDVTRLEVAGAEVRKLSLGRFRKSRNPFVVLTSLFGFFPTVLGLRRLIRKVDADVVQVNGLHHLHAAIAGKLSGVPVIWQFHSDQQPRWVRKLCLPLVRRWADAVMLAGEGLDRALGLAPDFHPEMSVFTTPVDTVRCSPDPDKRATARSQMNVTDEDIVIGAIGSKGPNKNHGELIALMRHFKGDDRRVKLRIFGPSEPAHLDWYMTQVTKPAEEAGLLADGTVAFHDQVKDVSVPINGFDIFCLPSRGEGSSLVLAEAMACEVPVVANAVGGIPKTVIDGENGFLNQTRSLPELIQHVEKLVDDAELRSTLGKQGRQFVLAHRSVESCAAATIGVCSRLTGATLPDENHRNEEPLRLNNTSER